jgi:GAF domain-containing protein
VRAFTDKQIELVTTFADQAAIAIENVRLFDEIQDKSRQLEEASQHKSRVLLECKPVQVVDVLADPEYAMHELQTKAGYRTVLGVPLLREGVPIGLLNLNRSLEKNVSGLVFGISGLFSGKGQSRSLT